MSRIINKYTRQTQSSQTSHTLALERRRRVEDLGALGKSRPSPASWSLALKNRFTQCTQIDSVHLHAHSHNHTCSLSLALVITLALSHTHTHTNTLSCALAISVGLGFANCVRSAWGLYRAVHASYIRSETVWWNGNNSAIQVWYDPQFKIYLWIYFIWKYQ